MTLPLSRNRTYASSSEIKSQDLNDVQDSIIGGKRGVAPRRVTPVGGEGANCAFQSAGYLKATSAAAYRSIRFDVVEGERIKEISFLAYGSGVGSISVELYKIDFAGAGKVSIAKPLASNPPASWNETTLTLGTAHTVGSAGSYFLDITLSTNNDRLGEIEVITDVP